MWPLFLISSIVLGLLNQWKIFWKVNLIELLEFLIGPGQLKASDRIWHAGILHKGTSYGISGQIFGLFCLFSIIDGLEWFCIGRLRKNIQLKLEFLRALFLILKFSYYTLLIFLVMLTVVLLLFTLLFTFLTKNFTNWLYLRLSGECYLPRDHLVWSLDSLKTIMFNDILQNLLNKILPKNSIVTEVIIYFANRNFS